MKAAVKEALVELFQERRELFHDIFKEVIEENITSTTVLRPPGSMDDDIENVVESEINAFRRLHPSLFERYPGEFVAIHGQQLVDHDAEKLDLYQRIQERYPTQFVLVRRVENDPEPELQFRSTRYFIHTS